MRRDSTRTRKQDAAAASILALPSATLYAERRDGGSV